MVSQIVLKLNLPRSYCYLNIIVNVYIYYLSLLISRTEKHLLEDTDQHMKTMCDQDTNDRCGYHTSDEPRVDKRLGHGQDASAYAAFK